MPTIAATSMFDASVNPAPLEQSALSEMLYWETETQVLTPTAMVCLGVLLQASLSYTATV